MKYWCSWQQWQRWTDDDDLSDEDLLFTMKDLTDKRPVREFVDAFGKYLSLQQLKEINALMDNPNRKLRNYTEALRDLSTTLNNLIERGTK